MYKKTLLFLSVVPMLFFAGCVRDFEQEDKEMAVLLEQSLQQEILAPWYPTVMDTIYGGYLSNLGHDFSEDTLQDKATLAQARHLWSLSQAYMSYPEKEEYKTMADSGFAFLKKYSFDIYGGGFFELLTRDGKVIVRMVADKSATTNAYAIYGLAAYYKATGNIDALTLAQETFWWLEQGRDPIGKGYFENLKRSGVPRFYKPLLSVITADNTTNFKSQNSTVHLMEAFTELYKVWPDSLLHERTKELLLITRDKLVTEEGYLNQYFQADWTPVLYPDSSDTAIRGYLKDIMKVSPGHDIETGYLMLEAMNALGYDDPITKEVAKKLIDHTIDNAFDQNTGGVFYEGLYPPKGDRDTLEILTRDKVWWVQAETLNSLHMMAHLYPSDKRDYFSLYQKQWAYIDEYLIDHEYGGWYWSGLDLNPESKEKNKSGIWKTTYHTYRALDNVINRSGNED